MLDLPVYRRPTPGHPGPDPAAVQNRACAASCFHVPAGPHACGAGVVGGPGGRRVQVCGAAALAAAAAAGERRPHACALPSGAPQEEPPLACAPPPPPLLPLRPAPWDAPRLAQCMPVCAGRVRAAGSYEPPCARRLPVTTCSRCMLRRVHAHTPPCMPDPRAVTSPLDRPPSCTSCPPGNGVPA